MESLILLPIAPGPAAQIAMEFGTTARMVESTAAAVRFGVDKEEAVDKLLKFCERLQQLETAVQVGCESLLAASTTAGGLGLGGGPLPRRGPHLCAC